MAGCDAGAPSRTIGARTPGVRQRGVRGTAVPEIGVRRVGPPGVGRPRSAVRTIAGALVAGVLLVGCGQEPATLPEGPVGDPLPTVDPAEAQAHDELLAAFDALRRAEMTVFADPQPPHLAQAELVDHLADPLLAATLFEVDLLYRRDLVRQGEPRWQASVVALDLGGTPPTATVRECVDASGWQVAARAGGPGSTDGLPQRYAMNAYVREYDATLFDEVWLFDDARMEEGEQC